MNRSSAVTTTAVTVVPSARDFSTAAAHTSSGIRSERGIVFATSAHQLAAGLLVQGDLVQTDTGAGGAACDLRGLVLGCVTLGHRGGCGAGSLAGCDVGGFESGVRVRRHVDTLSRLYLQRKSFARIIVTELAREMPYRLLGTATAAPNDYLERAERRRT